ncbi:type VI secretion system membrane subunit TssM [Mangrovicoccus algicola]|uniref:Type VI secretion system membrane subunit TssM n=1 Tax=Mangrovicoccus algicola TaxID=2771008 RepID=A0A8J6YWA1_9RHOB|nr:type VI secretion system membrane subunit TssM [Mangrovicoccus algicola]MBE3639055.1 type VI secretion system membrane subunit TssM [Mangrovicoccus algicola]
MKPILRALGSGPGLLILVALVFSAAIWTVGPLLAIAEARPLTTVTGRLTGLALLWLAVLLAILVMVLLRQKRETAIVEEVTAIPETPAAPDGYAAEDLAEMQGKLRRALKVLRGAKGGRKRLYDLPWYVIIGPPGAGKTTAIANSRLNFPLEDEFGKAALAGVGGTRNCDWWFTDQAVLIDTAGRYTTQDSDAASDNAAWLGFLAMLKRQRPRQPVNGALVAVSLADLANQDETSRRAHAQAIRRRLHELRSNLGIRFPVYVLFTKADLIAGFAESFEGLGREALAQVWGATLPLADPRDKTPAAERVAGEFDALVERLNAQLIGRLQGEPDPGRRALVAAFPAQVASLKPLAGDFLDELFRENSYEHRQMLRGVYFTSGTQEGTPIDRLMQGMAQSFGIGRQAVGSGQGAGRSYFLTGLFRDVIFPEAGLVSADDRAERRYRWSRGLAVAAAVLVAAGLGTLWARSYLGNRALLEETATRIAAYRGCIEGAGAGAVPAEAAAMAQAAGCLAEGLPQGPVGDSDLLPVLPVLALAEGLPGQDTAAPVPAGLGWGLYQGYALGNQGRLAYRAALNRHFLPRILLGLERQMARSVNDPDFLYDALKTYLMLGQLGPMDREHVRAWLGDDWQRAFPGASFEAERAALARHLDALLSQPMDRIDLNSDLVAQVQGVLTELPLAARVYSGILASEAARALPGFRLTDIGGPRIAAAMIRPSGRALNDPVPGIFTRRGFHEVVLGEAVNVAARVQAESWVLGATAEESQSEAALVALSRDVLDQYFGDYKLAYDQLLADIDIVPIETLSRAVEVTQILSGPSSPIVNILTAVAAETRLAEPLPAAQPAVAAALEAAGAAAERVAGRAAALRLGTDSRIFLEEVQKTRPPGPDGAPPPPGSYVQEEFAWLHALVAAPDGQSSELDGLIALLGAVYDDLNRLSIAGGVSDLAGNSRALADFRAAAGRLDGPMKRWAAQIAVGSGGVAAGGTRAAISAKWQAEVLPVCRQVTGNTYPFTRGARTDVPLQDFARLFAPGGLIDGFFTETLAPFVDTATNPWSWKTVNGEDLGISDAVLLELQHAAAIREAFFGGGTAQPQIRFQLTPQALDPEARSVAWEIDGQGVAFSQGDSPRPAAISWPGTVGLSQVVLERPKRNSVNDLVQTGPWALFRLLDQGVLSGTTAADRTRVTFNIGGRLAIFEIQAGSLANPFALPSLGRFSCPQSF